MEYFWKWLMRTDARSIFVTALLLFLAVSGWRLWVHLKPAPVSAPVVDTSPPPKLASFEALGVLDFVDSQFAPGALVVPVNPFRPTLEMMFRNPGSGDLREVVRAATERGGGRGGNWRWGEGGRDGGGGQRGAEEDGATPPAATTPAYSYRGMFRRPDGYVAAYVVAIPGGGRFVVSGDRLAGAEVLSTDKDGIVLKLPGGATHRMMPGDEPLEIGDSP